MRVPCDPALMRQAAELYARAGPCHDLGHVLRVAGCARVLAASESVEEHLATAAALLHDCGRPAADVAGTNDHDERSAVEAIRTLGALGWSAPEAERVGAAIRAHRFLRQRCGDRLADCVADADRLDALGLIGATRMYLYAGQHGWSSGDGDPARVNLNVAVAHWQTKLSLLPTRMVTAAARRMAYERAARLRAFLDDLGAELDEAVTGSPPAAAEPPS